MMLFSMPAGATPRGGRCFYNAKYLCWVGDLVVFKAAPLVWLFLNCFGATDGYVAVPRGGVFISLLLWIWLGCFVEFHLYINCS